MKLVYRNSKNFFGRNQKLLMILIVISLVLGLSNNSYVKYLVIALGLVEMFLVYIKMDINNISQYMFCLWIVLSAYVIFLLLSNFSIEFLSVSIQQIVLTAALFLNRRYSEDEYLSWCRDSKIMLLLFLLLDALYFYGHGYDFFSIPILGLSFFVALLTSRWRLLYLVIAVLLFVLRARSTMLAILTVLFVSVYLEWIKNKRFIYEITYWIFCLVIIHIPELYCMFYKSIYAREANTIIFRYTGKNLFSGREILWMRATELVEKNPLFGLGGRFIGGEFDTLGMSTHNLFLFMRLEGGYILLGLFLLAIYYVWIQIGKYMDKKYKAISAGYILALFIRVSFDLSFLANNFAQSIVLWIPIIFILNRCHNNKNLIFKTEEAR